MQCYDNKLRASLSESNLPLELKQPIALLPLILPKCYEFGGGEKQAYLMVSLPCFKCFYDEKKGYQDFTGG